MLASPHGASVLNMWIETLERIAKCRYGASSALGRVMLVDSGMLTEEQSYSHRLS
jgi:hypothetical protein